MSQRCLVFWDQSAGGFEISVEERERGRDNMFENTENEAKEKCVCLGRISPVSSRVADLVYEVC